MTVGSLPHFAARLTRLTEPAGGGTPDADLLRRFADAGDHTAFELLVWRYAGLVLGTCRRTLGRSADADDAFQATFLALARKPGSVRAGVALGGWLHTVATRAALRIRAAAGRRAEAPLPDDLPAPAVPQPDDTARVLDEEIARLPDKLRVAFVLCELEGRTDADAAAHLGCPKGTVLSRLARARARLRDRLARRGVTPAVVAVAARPSAELVAATVRGAVRFAAGAPADGRAGVAALAALRATAAESARPVAALMAAGIAIVLGVTLVAHGAPPTPAPLPPTPVRLAPPAKAPPAAPNFKLGAAGLTRLDQIQFSPDGKWLVGGGLVKGNADALAVWDAATGRHVHTLNAADAVSRWATFSPDGKTLASPDNASKAVTLWEVGTWKKRLALAQDEATHVAFSPDAGRAATWSAPFLGPNPADGVKVWDAATGKLLFEHRQGDEAFATVGFTADGKTLAVVTTPGEVRLLDAATGKVRHKLGAWAGQQVGMAAGRAGVLVWAYDTDRAQRGGAYLIDPNTGKTVRTFRTGSVYDAGFSPDGKRVVVSDNKLVEVWDVAADKVVTKLAMTDPPADTYGVEFVADGVVALRTGTPRAGGGENRSFGLFDPATGKELIRVPGAWQVAFDPTGKTMAVMIGDDVTVRGFADLLKGK